MTKAHNAMKKIAAVATLTVGGAFNAQAHIPEHYESLLAEYHDFIMNMKQPNGHGGTCCNERDAYINPPTKLLEDGSYVVTVDRDVKGELLPEPLEITIPADKVLSGAFAAQVCKEETAKGSTTCKAPPMGILWANPTYVIQGQPMVYCYWPAPLTITPQ